MKYHLKFFSEEKMQAAEHLQEILMGFQHFHASTQKLAENGPKLSVFFDGR